MFGLVITANQLGGGPFNGWSPKQTIDNYKDSEQTMYRGVLRRSWNTPYATGQYNDKTRIVTPFRAINNNGDFLCRVNYACGGPNPVNADRYKRKNNIGTLPSQCDTTGVPASSCNPKFVPDSSDYIQYRKLRALNQTYNDLSNVGDNSNGSYVALMGVHRR
jgi:hypothetical protein